MHFTDWLMVIITSIYVVATVLIWCANRKSANATKEQVIMAQQHYDETKRLQALPFLQLEKNNANPITSDITIDLPVEKEYALFEIGFDTFLLRNVGNGSAVNLVYTWESADKTITKNDYPNINAIGANLQYSVKFSFLASEKKEIPQLNAVLILQFEDILGNAYQQKILFDLSVKENTSSLVDFYENNPPDNFRD